MTQRYWTCQSWFSGRFFLVFQEEVKSCRQVSAAGAHSPGEQQEAPGSYFTPLASQPIWALEIPASHPFSFLLLSFLIWLYHRTLWIFFFFLNYWIVSVDPADGCSSNISTHPPHVTCFAELSPTDVCRSSCEQLSWPWLNIICIFFSTFSHRIRPNKDFFFFLNTSLRSLERSGERILAQFFYFFFHSLSDYWWCQSLEFYCQRARFLAAFFSRGAVLKAFFISCDLRSGAE